MDEQIEKLNLSFGISNTDIQAMHTAPLIRRENIFKDLCLLERKKCSIYFLTLQEKLE